MYDNQTATNPIVVRDEEARKLLVKFVGMTVYRLDIGAAEILGADGQWYPSKTVPDEGWHP